MTRSVFGVLFCALVATGCGNTDIGRSPTQLVMDSLTAAASPQTAFGTTLDSDVLFEDPKTHETAVYGDSGRASLALIMRDQATNAPSDLNQVTITRYRVSYRRTDGRSTPGVDVPFGFDSAATATVAANGKVTIGFDLVRNVAKQEAPLLGLLSSGELLSTIADVTFYGKDLSGNDISVAGSIGITFANFSNK